MESQLLTLLMIKKVLIVLLLGMVCLLAVLLFGYFKKGVPQPEAQAVKSLPLSDSAISHFQQAIRVRTISFSDTAPTEKAAFQQLHVLLQRSYPLVHSTMHWETVNEHSLLYQWTGTDTSLAPILLMGHMDVVPVGADSTKWEANPFAGDIKDSFIYGRGTLDDKIAIIGTLEAAETLLKQGYKPQRTIYFAFGHDEEISGKRGATQIGALLQQRHIHPAFVLDEGLAVTEGIISGIDQPVALIGTAEKGSVSFRLSINVHGGHSSQPDKENAIALLAKAIDRLEEEQMPAEFTPAFAQMSDVLSGYMPFMNRLALRNRWLMGPLILGQMSHSPALNAAIRTTTAPTIFQSGIKANIMPEEAYAVINFRILPGNTIEDVLKHIEKVVQDKRIQVKLDEFGENPSPSSPIDSADFKMLGRTVKSVFPAALVSPGLVIGATDSRHYTPVCTHIYRFSPITVSSEDLKRIHGVNERIPIKQYQTAVNFYYTLLKNAGLARW